ncbi:MAG: hypothetical protein R3E96_14825 [Planctomycetota bacterium]
MLTYQDLHVQARFDDGTRTLNSNPVWINVLGRGFDFCDVPGTQIGERYCLQTAVNSTGQPSSLDAFGSHCVDNNQVTLHAYDLPQNVFGYALNSEGQGLVANPGGSLGNLCLGGTYGIGRHVAPGDIGNSSTLGAFDVLVDVNQLPSHLQPISLTAGQAWNFQVWHRDGLDSNFTNAIQITFH